MVERSVPPDEKPGTMDSGVNITGDGPGRKIGNGVIVAYVATVGAVGWLVFTDHLDAGLGLAVFLGMFVLVFMGDMAIQYLDMHGEAPDTARDRIETGSPGD